MSAKLMVTGGSGLIGAEVCRQAVAAGHQVVSVSRGGAPADLDAPWVREVRWVAADVLEPAAWREELRGCQAVVHCVGIVLERPRKQETFSRSNGEAALVAVREAEAADVGRFVFVSAAVQPPLIDQEYLRAKRRAERALGRHRVGWVVLRPGLVASRRRPWSILAALALRVARWVPGVRVIARRARPLRVEVVARCALRAALDARVQGVLEVEEIKRLGSR